MFKRTETKLFLTVFLIYGFYVTITGPFNSVSALCVSIMEHGTFEVDQRVMHDYAIADGRKYSGYSPGTSWLLVPAYWVLKPFCAFGPKGFQYQTFSMLASLCMSIPLGALCVVALYQMLRDWQVERRTALLTALAFAFGTMWFVYARRHNSSSFYSSALIFLSFWLLELAPRTRNLYATFFGSGFLALLGVTADYKQVLTVFWLGVYLLLRHRSWKSCFWFASGALPPAIAMLAYNWRVWGHPLHTSYKYLQASFFSGELQPGLTPLQGSLHFHLGHLCELVVGPYTGFFVYTPVALLSLIGAYYYVRHRASGMQWVLFATAGILGSHLVLSASLNPFWYAGGSATYYGPATRYMLEAVPFVMIFVAPAAQRIKPAVTYFLVALSILINWMFVVSASYGAGASPIQPGWQNVPLAVHARHIVETFGAESVWFNFLASSHYSLGKAGAAAITWLGAVTVATLVWLIWRQPKTN